jgi:hypothetical protein
MLLLHNKVDNKNQGYARLSFTNKTIDCVFTLRNLFYVFPGLNKKVTSGAVLSILKGKETKETPLSRNKNSIY